MRAIIFDFDDTLLATRLRRESSLISTAARFGHELSAERIAAAWGRPFDRLIGALVPGVPYDLYKSAYAREMTKVRPQRQPGTLDLLKRLRRASVVVYVVSSGSRALVRQDLVATSLWQYVTRLWGFEDTRYHKPDPRVLSPVTRQLQSLGIRREQTAYVGDSVADWRVASARGVAFWAVLTGSDRRVDFRRAGLRSGSIVASLMDPKLRRALLPSVS